MQLAPDSRAVAGRRGYEFFLWRVLASGRNINALTAFGAGTAAYFDS